MRLYVIRDRTSSSTHAPRAPHIVHTYYGQQPTAHRRARCRRRGLLSRHAKWHQHGAEGDLWCHSGGHSILLLRDLDGRHRVRRNHPSADVRPFGAQYAVVLLLRWGMLAGDRNCNPWLTASHVVPSARWFDHLTLAFVWRGVRVAAAGWMGRACCPRE